MQSSSPPSWDSGGLDWLGSSWLCSCSRPARLHHSSRLACLGWHGAMQLPCAHPLPSQPAPVQASTPSDESSGSIQQVQGATPGLHLLAGTCLGCTGMMLAIPSGYAASIGELYSRIGKEAPATSECQGDHQETIGAQAQKMSLPITASTLLTWLLETIRTL